MKNDKKDKNRQTSVDFEEVGDLKEDKIESSFHRGLKEKDQANHIEETFTWKEYSNMIMSQDIRSNQDAIRQIMITAQLTDEFILKELKERKTGNKEFNNRYVVYFPDSFYLPGLLSVGDSKRGQAEYYYKRVYGSKSSNFYNDFQINEKERKKRIAREKKKKEETEYLLPLIKNLLRINEKKNTEKIIEGLTNKKPVKKEPILDLELEILFSKTMLALDSENPQPESFVPIVYNHGLEDVKDDIEIQQILSTNLLDHKVDLKKFGVGNSKVEKKDSKIVSSQQNSQEVSKSLDETNVNQQQNQQTDTTQQQEISKKDESNKSQKSSLNKESKSNKSKDTEVTITTQKNETKDSNKNVESEHISFDSYEQEQLLLLTFENTVPDKNLATTEAQDMLEDEIFNYLEIQGEQNEMTDNIALLIQNLNLEPDLPNTNSQELLKKNSEEKDKNSSNKRKIRKLKQVDDFGNRNGKNTEKYKNDKQKINEFGIHQEYLA